MLACRVTLCVVVSGSFLLAARGWPAEPSVFVTPHDTPACRLVEPDAERLKCYDDAARQQTEQNSRPPSSTQPESADDSSLMDQRWELDSETRHDIFSIRPHKQVYLLPARYTTNVNNQPSSPTQGTVPESLGYINTEVKFQFSFKMKALEVKERFDFVSAPSAHR